MHLISVNPPNFYFGLVINSNANFCVVNSSKCHFCVLKSLQFTFAYKVWVLDMRHSVCKCGFWDQTIFSCDIEDRFLNFDVWSHLGWEETCVGEYESWYFSASSLIIIVSSEMHQMRKFENLRQRLKFLLQVLIPCITFRFLSFSVLRLYPRKARIQLIPRICPLTDLN